MAGRGEVATGGRPYGGGMETTKTERRLWALGDYHRFATETVWGLGPVLVEACGITAGQRVLDVAAGTGKETFGPVIGIYASLAERPEERAALDRDFLEFATRSNQGLPGGPAEYPYEYLLVVGRKRE